MRRAEPQQQSCPTHLVCVMSVVVESRYGIFLLPGFPGLYATVQSSAKHPSGTMEDGGLLVSEGAAPLGFRE